MTDIDGLHCNDRAYVFGAIQGVEATTFVPIRNGSRFTCSILERSSAGCPSAQVLTRLAIKPSIPIRSVLTRGSRWARNLL